MLKFSCALLINYLCQLFVTITKTLIEIIKSIFLGLPVKSPDKIIPTVGLNSTVDV